MKICIFPNDPLIRYYEKGEIKERYFNPNNLFEEVHFITFSKIEVEPHKIKKVVGNAKIFIHKFDKIKIRDRKKFLPLIVKRVKEIDPDVIRGFNPLLEGWFAANSAKKLKIPFLLSLHTQYDENRKLLKKQNLKKFLALKYTEKFLEPFVLNAADKIIIIYKIIEPYVKKHSKTEIEILYNSIDCDKFSKFKMEKSNEKPYILSVGNLTPVKNHHILINAFKNIDANLIIIGQGELNDKLQKLIIRNKLEKKIKIISSIPNEDIVKYFKFAKIYSSAFNPEIESIPIPVMEALASGLPIVIPKNDEGLENVALFSEKNAESFEKNIKKLLNDKKLYDALSRSALEKSQQYDKKISEKKEAQIYLKLISSI